MNIQKILCMIIVAGLSNHALALEIYKGRVTNEKSWSTDGKKVTLVKNQLPRMIASNINLEYQGIYAYINSAEAKVGQAVTPNNITSVAVRNNTANNNTYRVIHTVCATIADHTERCSSHSQDLELDKDGYFSDSTNPALTLSFDKPGIYRIYAETQLYDKETGWANPATGVAASDIVVS